MIGIGNVAPAGLLAEILGPKTWSADALIQFTPTKIQLPVSAQLLIKNISGGTSLGVPNGEFTYPLFEETTNNRMMHTPIHTNFSNGTIDLITQDAMRAVDLTTANIVSVPNPAVDWEIYLSVIFHNRGNP